MNRFAVVLTGLLACGSASGEMLLDFKKGKKRPPPDPAAVWPHRWYLGGSVHWGTFSGGWATGERVDDGSFRSADSDDSSTGHSFYGGIEYKRNVALALEVGSIDLGMITYMAQSDGSGAVWAAGPFQERLKVKGTVLMGRGIVPVWHGVSLCVRLGVINWKGRNTYSGTTKLFGPGVHDQSWSNADPALGVGVLYDAFEDWRLQSTYMRYALSDSSNDFGLGFKSTVSALELSVAYLF